MNEIKLLRMNIMGGMHSYVLALGDEEIMDEWFACGLPESVTEEMLSDYAEDDNIWESVCSEFGYIIQEFENANVCRRQKYRLSFSRPGPAKNLKKCLTNK